MQPINLYRQNLSEIKLLAWPRIGMGSERCAAAKEMRPHSPKKEIRNPQLENRNKSQRENSGTPMNHFRTVWASPALLLFVCLSGLRVSAGEVVLQSNGLSVFCDPSTLELHVTPRDKPRVVLFGPVPKPAEVVHLRQS